MFRQKSSLFDLFYTSFAIVFVGFGLFPLLPLYATEFGASTEMVGIYMALTYVAITVGSLLPSWLPPAISRQRLFLAVSLPGPVALALLGRATTLWQVVLLTAIIWFIGGVGLATTSVLTGLTTRKEKAGRSFSLVSLSSPLGSLLGGTAASQLLAWSGYEAMFLALGLFWISLPLVVWLRLEDVGPRDSRAAHGDGRQPASASDRSLVFPILLLAIVLAAATVSIGRMGGSLAMKALTFSPSAVSSTAAISGLFMIPFVFLLSTYSDRIDRQLLLMGGYLMTAGGAAVLVVASSLWHFWFSTTLLLLGRLMNDSMAPAVATSLMPTETLGRALPRLKAANYIGGVLSFAGAGYAFEAVGMTTVFAIATALAITAAAVVRARPVLELLAGWKPVIVDPPATGCPELVVSC